MEAQPIRIGWKRLSCLPVEPALSAAMDGERVARLAQQIAQNEHSSFRLGPDLYLEIPPPTWGQGDFLAYLPARNLMVRRHDVDYWYLDVGLFRCVQDELYVWTDLWLEVIAPEPPVRYRVLDAEERAAVLRQGEVRVENAALALERLPHLQALLHREGTSLRELLPEVAVAEQFVQRYQHEAGRV